MNSKMREFEDAEAKFIEGLVELQYGKPVQDTLSELARSVPWAKGWPSNSQSFWNAEAFMWQKKVERPIRELIAAELQFLAQGKNLDLGCGASSYIPSTGFDLSPMMLKLNDSCTAKVQGSLEKPLPFEEQAFDSTTAIFVLNYVANYSQLLGEIYRVLRNGGIFMMVLYSGEINDWQRQKEMSVFSAFEWQKILQAAGFNVEFYEKEKLWFFKCRS